MIVLKGIAAKRNETLPVLLEPGSGVVALLDDDAQKLTSERGHGLRRPASAASSNASRHGVRAKLLMAGCDRSWDDRLSDLCRHAGKIDGRAALGERAADMGTLLMLGFAKDSILLVS